MPNKWLRIKGGELKQACVQYQELNKLIVRSHTCVSTTVYTLLIMLYIILNILLFCETLSYQADESAKFATA